MNIGMFAGMVSGIVAAVVLILISGNARRRRNPAAEDERMVMVKAQAGSLALRVVGAIAFIGWVVDNLLAYSRGEAIRTITPWSLMLLVTVVAYDVALAYILYQHGGGEVTRKDADGTLALAAAIILIFLPQLLHGEFRGDAGLRYLLIGVMALQAATALWTLYRVRGSFRGVGGGEA